MKIFISYIVKDKHLAGKIKKRLDSFGFDSFLAHEDIQPTQLWMDTIYDNLKGSDLLLALLTKDFQNSLWCNQEIGIAYALNKLIIPIKIDENPHGFLSKYQALKLTRNSAFPLDKLIAVISQDEKLGNPLKDFLINALANSHSFIDSNEHSEIISGVNNFSKRQLEKIMKVSIANDQIYKSTRASKILSNYIWTYKSKVNPELYTEFNKFF